MPTHFAHPTSPKNNTCETLSNKPIPQSASNELGRRPVTVAPPFIFPYNGHHNDNTISDTDYLLYGGNNSNSSVKSESSQLCNGRPLFPVAKS